MSIQRWTVNLTYNGRSHPFVIYSAITNQRTMRVYFGSVQP